MKKIVFIFVLLILITITGCNNKITNITKIENNNATNVVELEKIIFSEIVLKTDNGITTLTAKAKSTKDDIGSIRVKISYKDENSNVVKESIQIIENITTKDTTFTTGFIGNSDNIKEVQFEIVED